MRQSSSYHFISCWPTLSGGISADVNRVAVFDGWGACERNRSLRAISICARTRHLLPLTSWPSGMADDVSMDDEKLSWHDEAKPPYFRQGISASLHFPKNRQTTGQYSASAHQGGTAIERGAEFDEMTAARKLLRPAVRPSWRYSY